MKNFEYDITVSSGLDVQPTGLLYKEVRKYKSDVVIHYGQKSARVMSLLALLQLGIKCGDTVKITIEGEDEAAAAAAIEEFFKVNL